jgi:DNA polymerase-3 subunit gamma/tau
MNQPLHLKYRPANFDEIVGNKGVVDSLKSVLSRKEGTPHAFLLVGNSGCGKTTIARIIKKHLKCSNTDFQELNAANVRGIDAIRDIAQNCRLYPVEGDTKIFLLDEAAKLTTDAQNALLKLLEDTPEHVYIILCTTDPEKLLKTIRTRCHTYTVQQLTDRDMKSLLYWVLKSERIEGFPEKGIEEIVRAADGSPRQALVILDSVVDIQDDNDLIAAIVNYSINETTIHDLCKALLERQKWTTVAKIIKGITDEPEKVRYAVLGYMGAVLTNSDNEVAAIIIEQFLDSFMYSGKAGLIYACYSVVK